MPDRIVTPFTAASTAAEVIDGVDLTGRRAIVTGGASGIGIETARALASAGAEVTLAVRNLADGARRRGRHHRHHRQQGRPRRLPRPRRPLLDRGLRRRVGRPAAHPRQQRGRDGLAADPYTRGLGIAVRHQPPRALRAGHRPAPGPGRGRRRPGRRGQLVGAPRARQWSSTTSTSSAGSTSPGRPTASRRRPTCCSPSRAAGAGPDDGITVNALHPGGIRTNLQRHVSEDDLERARRAAGTQGHLAYARAGCRHLGAVGRVTAGRRRGRALLRGLRRGGPERAGHPHRRRGLRAGPGSGGPPLGCRRCGPSTSSRRVLAAG